MIRFQLQSKKGSTLAMLILVIGILVILGTALLTATFVGYTAKMEELQKKTAFYAAEAGIDEAYAYLGEEVENASQYSRKVYVPTEVANATVKNPDFANQPKAAYQAFVNTAFKKGYISYFKTNELGIQGRLQEKLDAKTGDLITRKSGENERIAEISAVISQSFDAANLSSIMNIDFTTHVQRNLHDYQTLSTTLEIRVPDYDTPYYSTDTTYKIKHNALFDKALAADKNLYVSGGEVIVSGNVFAHGEDKTDALGKITGPGDGVVLGGTDPLGTAASGRLDVKGHLDTNGLVQIRRSVDSDKSTLSVNGDIACNSLTVEDRYGGTPNTSATIAVGGSALVYDDTELNALKSNISIAGNYYGFSSGRESTQSHDQSSGIIVNADDIGEKEGSLLYVGGAGGSRTFIEPGGSAGVSREVAQGVYLAGTVYVDQEDDPTRKYQTGDSVSVVRNYAVYSQALNLAVGTGDGQVSQGDFDAYSGIDPDDPLYSSFYSAYGPLNLIDFKKSSDSPDGKATMLVTDKTKYGYYGYRQDASKVRLAGIELNNVQYAIGNYIVKSGASSEMRQDKGDISSYESALSDLGRQFKYQVNGLSDLQNADFLKNSDTSIDTYGGIRNWVKSDWKSSTDADIDTLGSADKYYLRHSPSSEVLILKGSGVSEETKKAVDSLIESKKLTPRWIDCSSAGTTRGILLTSQDVYCLGTFTFDGLVATEGNIYCMGGGTKTFSNTATTPAYNNFVVQQAILGLKEKPSPSRIGYWFRQESSWKIEISKVVSSEGLYGGANDIGYTGSMKNMIRITKWHRTP